MLRRLRKMLNEFIFLLSFYVILYTSAHASLCDWEAKHPRPPTPLQGVYTAKLLFAIRKKYKTAAHAIGQPFGSFRIAKATKTTAALRLTYLDIIRLISKAYTVCIYKKNYAAFELKDF